jgi:hypothetical protein
MNRHLLVRAAGASFVVMTFVTTAASSMADESVVAATNDIEQETSKTSPEPPTPAAPVAAPPIALTTPAPASEASTTDHGPNRSLILMGLVAFGWSYAPAVLIAGDSPRQTDRRLYVPVAGPWLDLGHRGVCTTDCESEEMNRELLIVDGILQGAAVVAFVAGLLSSEHERPDPKNEARPRLRVTPTRMGSAGYGVSAFGAF